MQALAWHSPPNACSQHNCSFCFYVSAGILFSFKQLSVKSLSPSLPWRFCLLLCSAALVRVCSTVSFLVVNMVMCLWVFCGMLLNGRNVGLFIVPFNRDCQPLWATCRICCREENKQKNSSSSSIIYMLSYFVCLVMLDYDNLCTHCCSNEQNPLIFFFFFLLHHTWVLDFFSSIVRLTLVQGPQTRE